MQKASDPRAEEQQTEFSSRPAPTLSIPLDRFRSSKPVRPSGSSGIGGQSWPEPERQSPVRKMLHAADKNGEFFRSPLGQSLLDWDEKPERPRRES